MLAVIPFKIVSEVASNQGLKLLKVFIQTVVTNKKGKDVQQDFRNMGVRGLEGTTGY